MGKIVYFKGKIPCPQEISVFVFPGCYRKESPIATLLVVNGSFVWSSLQSCGSQRCATMYENSRAPHDHDKFRKINDNHLAGDREMVIC